jgi:RNA polymerase sigma-70 factor (ECF subfamily)
VDAPNVALASGLEMADNFPMSRSGNDEGATFRGTTQNGHLAELIARGRTGDLTAMEEIYGRYKTALFHLASRYARDRATAEDLLQEIFIKVFTHLGDIDRVETFTAWVYRVALNTCYSYLRGARTEIEKSVPLDEIEGTLASGAADEAAGDFRKPLDEAIEQLPRRLKEIFLLHDVQGFKHEEIARLLGLSVGTSKSQLFKARLRLRGILKAKGMC